VAPRESFEVRAVSVEVGVDRIYNEAEWRDALVVVARGEIELQDLDGDVRSFGRGAILCLVGLPLRALRSRGTEAALLVAVSRRDRPGPAQGTGPGVTFV
jgi:hypothetical protein